jgi:hypothetical protein
VWKIWFLQTMGRLYGADRDCEYSHQQYTWLILISVIVISPKHEPILFNYHDSHA